MLKPGDNVFHRGTVATISSIAPRQNRGLCAYCVWHEGSITAGEWVEIGRISALGNGVHIIYQGVVTCR